jgi:TPR repeat protein
MTAAESYRRSTVQAIPEAQEMYGDMLFTGFGVAQIEMEGYK